MKINYLFCIFFVILCNFGMSKRNKVNQRINVSLILYSHDDLGWTNTIDEYYSKLNKQLMGNVRKILTNVIDGLIQNSTRKFSYSVIGFFSKWWDEQTLEKQNQV